MEGGRTGGGWTLCVKGKVGCIESAGTENGVNGVRDVKRKHMGGRAGKGKLELEGMAGMGLMGLYKAGGREE